MPGVVPDLTRIAVDAQHPAGPAVLLGVYGVVAVEPHWLLRCGAGRDTREVGVGYLPRLLGVHGHLVSGVATRVLRRGGGRGAAHHALAVRSHHPSAAGAHHPSAGTVARHHAVLGVPYHVRSRLLVDP